MISQLFGDSFSKMSSASVVTYICILICFNIVWCDYNLSIIHFNDFHARYEPVNNLSTTCQGPHCIGGFSRIYSTIKQMKNSNPSSLLLNAGDNYQGSLWYIIHKWNVTQHFLNKLPLDAITLGNHEFDDGISGLVPFLKHIQAPVVVSNINSGLEPRLENLYNKSVIVEKNGKKIGIIGVLTSTTNLTSHTENLIFEDESDSVNSQAEKLSIDGVFTNIVLSHCGYETDLEIAKKSDRISAIVGGHTDTFLFTGSVIPGPDKPEGPYPTVVLNKNGGRVLVVQASAYTKYLGNITISYDEFGNVTGWSGAPIFLGPTILTDPEIDAELEVWKKSVDSQGQQIVGCTVSTMRDKPCRSEECLLGNFATDAMVSNYRNKTTIAMLHAGGMRAGIEAGNITFNQLTSTFPFQDRINLCDIKGKHIKEILETSVDDKHLKFPHLFQVSGLRVIFNISKPEGQRVQDLKILVNSTNYEDIALDNDFTVLLPTFLTNSNFNPLFRKYITKKVVGDGDLNVYIKYLTVWSPLDQKIEGRIEIVE